MNDDRRQRERLMERVTHLETLITHFQRTVEVLNEVVIDQGKRLDRLELQLSRAADQVASLSQRLVEPRTLEDDKPPHY